LMMLKTEFPIFIIVNQNDILISRGFGLLFIFYLCTSRNEYEVLFTNTDPAACSVFLHNRTAYRGEYRRGKQLCRFLPDQS